jgi:Permuted papain-like amidase enzyme, YaeF/YiiX, C92 family
MKNYLKISLAITMFLVCSTSLAYAGGGSKDGSDSQPQYYSFEDLRSGLRAYMFWFQNANKPSTALADLSYDLEYPAVASKNFMLQNAVISNPAKYGADGMHIQANWNDSQEINVDWDVFKAASVKGDLLFSRANGQVPDFIKLFSNWTHVAIVYSPADETVLEATLINGVQVDNAPDTHTHITYYTYRRLTNMSANSINTSVENAVKHYLGKPYFPQVSVSDPITGFLLKWCDKDDMSSMYCSKLVYNTFKGYFNADTDRTTVNSLDLGRPIGGPFFAWIGVSPDDIYYSPALGYDFCYSTNVLDL